MVKRLQKARNKLYLWTADKFGIDTILNEDITNLLPKKKSSILVGNMANNVSRDEDMVQSRGIMKQSHPGGK